MSAGVVSIRDYATTRGAEAEAPRAWPVESQLQRTPFGATVVMFVHPDCPCTRASKAELAKIQASAPPTTKFIVTPVVAEATRFGAKTSGDVVVYDVAGQLQFHGGITATRGHVGPSRGHDLVDDLIHGRVTGSFTAPVFGCAL
ncbi:MAG: hypothetical protein QM831_13935 [Kofleriaceae bacterium]